MAEVSLHPVQDAGLESEFAGACLAHPKVLLHQRRLFETQAAVEKIIESAKGFFARASVHWDIQLRRAWTLPQAGQP